MFETNSNYEFKYSESTNSSEPKKDSNSSKKGLENSTDTSKTTNLKTGKSKTIEPYSDSEKLQTGNRGAQKKVLLLDVLVGNIFGFVDVRTLGISCKVCTVWRDTGSLQMFWIPLLERRWGSLLPMNRDFFEKQPKQMYRKCLVSENKIMVKEASYQTTKTLMDGKLE